MQGWPQNKELLAQIVTSIQPEKLCSNPCSGLLGHVRTKGFRQRMQIKAPALMMFAVTVKGSEQDE